VLKEVPSVADAPTHWINLLDGFSLRRGHLGPGEAGGDLPYRLQRLVAHLCLSGRPARTAIAGRLWPDVSEKHAQGNLRSALWSLHKIAPGLVEASSSCLALAECVRVDVHELSDWAHRALDPRAAIDELTVLDDSLGGDLLPGWYDDWVLLERERLSQLRAHALEVVAGRLADVGRHGQAIQTAYAAVRAEPLRESAHRTVVRVLLAEGNVAEAVRVYQRFRVMLREELGIAPTAQMARLVCGLPGTTPGGLR
jgi:DNA-binding SARP family transcriptional activator